MQARCTRPLRAWYSRQVNPETGKKIVVFDSKDALIPEDPFNIPCGRCIGCKYEKSRQWAIRCYHESKLHDQNCFLTLTFNNENLSKREEPFSVKKRDFQLFMKKLRKQAVKEEQESDGKLTRRKLGYFHCGEYGEENQRPHYHACIFNYDFPDKQLFTTSGGNRLYVSEILNGTKIMEDSFPQLKNRINTPSLGKPIKGLWPYGSAIIGEVTFQSASYTARYIMKKAYGQQLMIVDEKTGLTPLERYDEYGQEIVVEPEYCTMSRNPAIGLGFLEKYKGDMYPKDYMHVNGVKVRPPKYYDRKIEEKDPFEYQAIKNARAKHKPEETTVRREQQLDELHIEQNKRFIRDMQRRK